jgi:hypothetical protein
MRWAFCAVLFPLAIFSAKLSHSYYFGMSGAIWLTANIFVILSAAAMARAAQTQSSFWLFASLLAALLGLLTYSTAIYSLLVLLLFCTAFLLIPRFRGEIPWPALAAVIAIVLVTVATWLAFRPHPKGHPPLEFDPIGLAAFVLVYLGSALAEGYVIPVVGMAIVICAALAIHHLIRQGRGREILLWITLFLFAPFNALMTGIGRLGFGLQAAASSRYQSVAAISLLATIVLVLAAVPKASASLGAARIRAATLVALVAMAAFLIANSKSRKFYAARLEDKPIAEIAFRQDIAGDRHLRAATPVLRRVQELLPTLRAMRHVPFDTRTRCEELIGKILIHSATEAIGAMESGTVYRVWQGTREAVELHGWILKAGFWPECIVVLDAGDRVIGAGLLGSRAPTNAPDDPSKIGWRAVIHPSDRRPICAFAVLHGTSTLKPIANCLTSFGPAQPGQKNP